MPLWQNMTSVCLNRFASKFLSVLKGEKERSLAKAYMDKVNVKAVDESMLAYQLSDGNQQKMIIAKWFMKEPKIFFMDEPTKGVDVGAKAEIQKLIFNTAKSGMSFVIISSELEEIMYLCDRIIVLNNSELFSIY
ncbi:MAG: ATP-binding cassette domain-containing protein [Candidatus Humimicrobiaceae bacterium]